MLSPLMMLCVSAVALTLFVNPARAHVHLHNPNGGEVLEVGSTFTIVWEIDIQHVLLNWDVWYSTTSPGGPWTTIVMDLPAGSPFVGSIHTYDWTVPDDVDGSVWVRVRMDNQATDYFDVSDLGFSIVPPPCPLDLDGSGDVGFGDLLAVLTAWGPCVACPEDFDGSGDVGFSDLLDVITAWGPCR